MALDAVDPFLDAGGIGASIGNPVVFGAELLGAFLGGLFSSIFGGGDIDALKRDVQNLRDTLSNAISKVTRFTWTTAFALGALLNLFHDFFVGDFAELYKLVKKLAAAFQSLIQTVLKDIVTLLKWVWLKGIPDLVAAMQKLRKWLNMIYLKYVKPLLDYIQIVRRYLAILRIFHVKWAAKLDLELGRIEARIIGPYLYVLRTLNGIGQWVNVILTVKGTIQRAVFINTMYAYQSDWVNMFWWGQQATTTSSAPAPSTTPAQPPTIAQVETDFGQWTTTGTGVYEQHATAAQSAFDSVILAA